MDKSQTVSKRTLLHLSAFFLAWLVTVIWGSSFILIKLGLDEIPPLTFAALRYTLGGLILIFWLLVRRQSLIPNIGPNSFGLIAASGVAAYTFGQGFLYTGQVYVSALTASFFFSLAPIFVLVLSMMHLYWRPQLSQLIGLFLVGIGSYLFFPPSVALEQWQGVILLIASNIGTAYYLILVRRAHQNIQISPTQLTAFALLCGGLALVPLALMFEGVHMPSTQAWLLIIWLALINTAFAYTLWNLVLRTLPPFELSIMGNIIPLNTAMLNTLFFGVRHSAREIVGLMVVVAGVIIVQMASQALRGKR
jgi:drug/metabolite transporter (DMT)-like permease